MQRFFSSSLLYLTVAAFIIGWWMLAFQKDRTPLLIIPANQSQSLVLKTANLLEELLPFQRETLQKALAGHFPLMLKLIEDWDQEAQLLARRGIGNIQRLPAESYLQTHIIAQLLRDSSPDSLRRLNCRLNLDAIQDDSGRLVCIEDTFQRFLPQTFAAASFLMAIAPPDEITALPKGMRYLPQIYSIEKLASIPANIDRTHSERLFLAQPHLAFVAPYSHPPALEVLKNQKIQLYTLKYFDTLAEIQEALLKIGHASNHILEAQLLALFMEASFLAIDNRLQALEEIADHSRNAQRLLYLYYHQNYMIPTTKSLTGQLMTRALSHCPHFSCQIPESRRNWRIPFEQEKILKAEPECLIISTYFYADTQALTHNQQAMQQTEAFKSGKIFYLDEAIQESPTQYIVLAYFDIFQAIEGFAKIE